MIYFYRLNVIDFYNYNMGNVDIANQLRNVYRHNMQWHRNQKWWWEIWWWGFQCLLTNLYIAYVRYHKMHDSTTNYVLHYKYIKSVALAWIEPEVYWPEAKTKKQAALGLVPEGFMVNKSTGVHISKEQIRKRIRDCSNQHSVRYD